MYYTGFADEAAADIEGQIRATKALGWSNIESRNINGTNIHDLSDAEFDKVCEALEGSGVRINCFGSTIANWGKWVTDPFDDSLEEARRAIPRMQRLGTPMVRIMSFGIMKDRDPSDQMKAERFRRVRELVRMFGDAGLTCVHENCQNYGGMGWPFMLEVLEQVPGLKFCFDTGNPAFTADYTSPRPESGPRPRQSSWEYYTHVKEHIAYMHIKDCTFVAENPGGIFDHADFTFPGEGDGDVRRIVADLVASGYDGGFSIEPHMQVVFHDDSGEAKADAMMENYIEYGRRFMRMVDAARAKAEE
jgi:sugar phosphate isomerase/epimerase